MNVIALLELDLAYYDVAAFRDSHYATVTSLFAFYFMQMKLKVICINIFMEKL